MKGGYSGVHGAKGEQKLSTTGGPLEIEFGYVESHKHNDFSMLKAIFTRENTQK